MSISHPRSERLWVVKYWLNGVVVLTKTISEPTRSLVRQALNDSATHTIFQRHSERFTISPHSLQKDQRQ